MSAAARAAQVFIPSPTVSGFQIGPFTVRFYALCILTGIVAGLWLTARRLRARGGTGAQVADIALWAVPLGIAGGRLYHVITDPELYFVPGRNPWNAFALWEGGLGIWGAVALGALGAWIGARRSGVPFAAFADAAAPALLLAQAIGRWGNWFNNELYGAPSTLPWKLQIHQMDPATASAVTGPDGNPVVLGFFEPTFLYESLWDLAAAAALLWADRRFRPGVGAVFALYIPLYTAGRFAVELMRTDFANTFLGLRVNTWTSGLLFLAGTALFLALARRRPPSTVPTPTTPLTEKP